MTTSPAPGIDPNINPKAAAKAAHAYAKAQRPWFKKKRWWVLAVIVAMIVIGSLSNHSNGPTLVANNGTSGNSGSGATVGAEGNPAKIGQTIQLAGTRYTVRKAVKTKSVGGTFGTKANGVFVVVTLTIENMKNETKTFLDASTKFVASGGKLSYSPDTTGTAYAGRKALILQDMQPQLPTTGQIVFDVPPSKVKGGLLEVSDLFGDGSAYIRLGLR